MTPPAGTLPAPPVRMTGLMDAFLAAVERGGPALVAGQEIIALQRLIDALYASLRSGREVSLAPG